MKLPQLTLITILVPSFIHHEKCRFVRSAALTEIMIYISNVIDMYVNGCHSTSRQGNWTVFIDFSENGHDHSSFSHDQRNAEVLETAWYDKWWNGSPLYIKLRSSSAETIPYFRSSLCTSFTSRKVILRRFEMIHLSYQTVSITSPILGLCENKQCSFLQKLMNTVMWPFLEWHPFTNISMTIDMTHSILHFIMANERLELWFWPL